MKMMIVDDSTVIRRKIQRSTEVQPISKFCFATNGLEAVSVFKSEKPHVVTMDLTMPKMDGVECVKQVMELDPSVNILVISALSDKATALKAIKNGARGFLCKPFNDQQLNDALKELINDVVAV